MGRHDVRIYIGKARTLGQQRRPKQSEFGLLKPKVEAPTQRQHVRI